MKSMSKQIKEVMSEFGKRGRGKSKCRGNHEFYSKIGKLGGRPKGYHPKKGNIQT